MSALKQPIVVGDWLKYEEENLYGRKAVTVSSGVDLVSGTVMGTESTLTTTYVPYDNSNAAAAAGILVNPFTAATKVAITSVVVATNVGTITFPADHGLIVGDVVAISGATVDLQLTCLAPVLTVPTSKTCTVTTANVADATYTEATLLVNKANQGATLLARGPALVNFNNVNWGTTDTSGITAGKADLATLLINSVEGA